MAMSQGPELAVGTGHCWNVDVCGFNMQIEFAIGMGNQRLP